MTTLTLRCKACDTSFPSGIRAGVFGMPRLGALERECPACRRRDVYAGDDFALLRAHGAA